MQTKLEIAVGKIVSEDCCPCRICIYCDMKADTNCGEFAYNNCRNSDWKGLSISPELTKGEKTCP